MLCIYLGYYSNDTINNGVHVAFQITVLVLGYVPESRTAGSHASSVFSFLRDFHTIPQWLYKLTVPPAVSKGCLFFSTHQPTFVVYALFDDRNSDRCGALSPCGFAYSS